MKEDVLSEAIAWAGGKSALARRVGVTRSAVSHWIKRGRVPAESALKIERLSCGLFKAVDLYE